MSIALRVTTTEQVVRVTAPGQSPLLLVRPAPLAQIKVSEVGMQGPEGPPGAPGKDGAAQMPAEIDGGSF